jgi:hypothetical protein
LQAASAVLLVKRCDDVAIFSGFHPVNPSSLFACGWLDDVRFWYAHVKAHSFF